MGGGGNGGIWGRGGRRWLSFSHCSGSRGTMACLLMPGKARKDRGTEGRMEQRDSRAGPDTHDTLPCSLPCGWVAPRTASSLASHMEPDQNPVTWSETEEEALGLTPDPVSGQGSIWHLGHVMACDLRRGQVPTWPYPCCRCVLSCVCDFWAFKCPFASTHLMAQNHHQQRIQVYAGPSPRPNWSCPTVSGFVRGSTPTTASGAEISLCPHLPLSVPRAPLPMPIGTELGLHTPTFQGGTKDRVNLERAPFPSLPSPFPILSDVDSGHSIGAPALTCALTTLTLSQTSIWSWCYSKWGVGSLRKSGSGWPSPKPRSCESGGLQIARVSLSVPLYERKVGVVWPVTVRRGHYGCALCSFHRVFHEGAWSVRTLGARRVALV